MRHATAKFGSLVHRFGMISIGGLHAREFFEIDFLSFLDPPNRGYFEGAPAFLHKSEVTVIESILHIS